VLEGAGTITVVERWVVRFGVGVVGREDGGVRVLDWPIKSAHSRSPSCSGVVTFSFSASFSEDGKIGFVGFEVHTIAFEEGKIRRSKLLTFRTLFREARERVSEWIDGEGVLGGVLVDWKEGKERKVEKRRSILILVCEGEGEGEGEAVLAFCAWGREGFCCVVVLPSGAVS